MPPGGIGGSAAPPPLGNPGMGPGGYAPIETGERLGVEYVPLDPEKLEGKRLALTIYPQRMVVVHAAFPYKAQVEEIQKALRIEKDKASEVFNLVTNDDPPVRGPYFRGFVVERQILLPDGTVDVPWQPLDAEGNYRSTIFPRKVGDKEDDPSMAYVMLGEEHELDMPLPLLLSGGFPAVQLPGIKATIQKLSTLNKPPAQPKSPSKLLGEGSIWGNKKASQAASWGNTGLIGKGKGSSATGDKEKDPSGNVAVNDLPDSILVRILDNDIVPGRLYQYRIRLKMQNPNWAGKKDEKGKYEKPQKFDLVSRPSDAEVELIEGLPVQMRAGTISQVQVANAVVIKSDSHNLRTGDSVLISGVGGMTSANGVWTVTKIDDNTFSIPASPNAAYTGGGSWTYIVSVPREDFLFAIDPPLDPTSKDNKKTTITLKSGEALLQVQRWLPMATIGNYKEPVADWVVADIMVKRGHYLGGKQFVTLPIWDSLYNRYILREQAADKLFRGKGQPKRGVEMDPTKPGPTFVVVEVKGGYAAEQTPRMRISDESACEVLLLDESGNLQVRSSVLDRLDPERNKREETWKQWVDKTEKESPGSDAPPKSKGTDFDK
jgi:hypothetical protein